MSFLALSLFNNKTKGKHLHFFGIQHRHIRIAVILSLSTALNTDDKFHESDGGVSHSDKPQLQKIDRER